MKDTNLQLHPDVTGHVLYASKKNKEFPIGIVSESYERKARLTKIPPNFVNILLAIEDRRFYSHKGIDILAIIRACSANIKAGKIVQGGSTISQQLARSLMRDNSRTVRRKLLEALNAMEIEQAFSKSEIINLYLENAYFGNNLIGLRSASLYYFNREPITLTVSEQLALLTLLRGPNYYLKNSNARSERYRLLTQNLLANKLISKKSALRAQHKKIRFQSNKLQVFPSSSIPFITNYVDVEQNSVHTSLDFFIQKILSTFVEESEFPVSAICLSRTKVLGVASSYGNSYPFETRTNVGSTLKPFIYCFLRENGIGSHQTFKPQSNDTDWNVREVLDQRSLINLSDALFTSNNNAFINACHEVGFDRLFVHLSHLIGVDEQQLSPSIILGASKSGLSLYQLTKLYADKFLHKGLSNIELECISVLKSIAKTKLNIGDQENLFLKTGTTNGSREKFVLVGNSDYILGLQTGLISINDKTKDETLMMRINNLVNQIFKNRNKNKINYKWT